MIITSGDYRLRPLTIGDEQHVVECLLDFPIRITKRQAAQEFGHMIYISDGFDEDRVNSEVGGGLCLVLEYRRSPVGFRFTRFQHNVAEIAMLARHPEARQSGHQAADSYLHGALYFDHLHCLSCFFEAADTAPVNAAAARWRSGTAAPESVRKSRWDKQDLRSVTIMPNEFRAIMAADPRWADAEITISDA